jgi:hypothetical protein
MPLALAKKSDIEKKGFKTTGEYKKAITSNEARKLIEAGEPLLPALQGKQMSGQ